MIHAMTMRSVCVAIACMASVALAVEGDFKSGPQPGESTAAFNCRDVTGPNKGKSLCYV